MSKRLDFTAPSATICRAVMRTFFISTLGCKVNQYESQQLATLLRERGLVQVDQPEHADLRVVNTCSVTVQAASKSRQAVRRLVRLPVLGSSDEGCTSFGQAIAIPAAANQRVLVTGCWATSDKADASKLPGVSAVLGHHDDVAPQIVRLIQLWQGEDRQPPTDDETRTLTHIASGTTGPESMEDGWMKQAGTPDQQLTPDNKSHDAGTVKENPHASYRWPSAGGRRSAVSGREKEERATHGTVTLPLLGGRQDANQRAFLKVQDGCDAHCTYCIIPKLRPRVWSKPVDDAVHEARRLVAAGHQELILTGIFLGAYGQPTALRRRQPSSAQLTSPMHELVEALCTRVEGLQRLRLSSLEPGDLTDELIALFRLHPQVVPHFHLPLQSGSDELLRRMNRQYTRDDFLRMSDRVKRSFDRPAITTDIIVGFPGETEEEFRRTLEVVDAVGFLHIHAFSFSPRPGTAASRWRKEFVHGPVVNRRIDTLNRRAADFSLTYRRQFVGEMVELMVERPGPDAVPHGRCERYFTVWFDSPERLTARRVKVRVDRVTSQRTHGSLVEVLP